MANVERVIGEKYKLSLESEICPTCATSDSQCVMKYCIDCRERFCSVCSDTGGGNTEHSSHNITECPKIPKAEEDNVLFTCDEHPNRKITMICKFHDHLCCSDCVKEKHGSCAILTLSDAYKDFINSETEMKMLENIKLVKESLIDTIQLHQNMKKVLQNGKDQIIKVVREFNASMKQILENMERSTISSLSKACENVETEYRQNAETADKFLSGILKYEKEMKLGTLSDSEKIILVKRTDQQIESSRIAGEKCFKPPVRNIQFEPNEKIRSLLQEAEHLGTFFFCSYEKSSCEKVPNCMVCSGQIIKDVNTEEDEEDCRISRSCTIPNGDVLLIDYANMKLKRLKRASYEVFDYFALEHDAFDVDLCTVDNDEVMIGMGQKVMFVSVCSKMEIVRSFNLSHDCHCLGYHGGKVFVSDGSGVIRLYTMSGTQISEIHTDVYENSLECSEDGNLMYLVAEEEMAAIDMHGTIARRCGSEELGMRSLTDVCLDGFGNIIVCGHGPYESNDVVTFIDAAGKGLGTYDGGFEHYYNPSCVCFDKQRLKIVVANSAGDRIVVNDMRYNSI